jgi:DNA uptake protein ComE-like DNA-binding protein
MTFRKSLFVLTTVMLSVLAGCNTQKQTPEDLREQTAKATAEIKSDAKAVAQGVREGWSRNKPLDLNSATKDQLLSLPDMTESDADRIIAGRPYNDPNDLVRRHILHKSEYDKISDQVTAKR